MQTTTEKQIRKMEVPDLENSFPIKGRPCGF